MSRDQVDKSQAETFPETPAALARAVHLRRPEELSRAIELLGSHAAGEPLLYPEHKELLEILGLFPETPEQAADWLKSLKVLGKRRPSWND